MCGGCHGSDEKKVFYDLWGLVGEMIMLYQKEANPLPDPASEAILQPRCRKLLDNVRRSSIASRVNIGAANIVPS